MLGKSRALFVFLGVFAPGVVFGLGLGDLTLQSYLNEPLRAEVTLLESAGLNVEQVKIRLAGSEDFERSGIERSYFLTKLQFEVELQPDGTGKLLVTSDEPVLEPFLDFILEARWPNGRLLREYTLLLDPPVFTGTQSATTSASLRQTPAEEPEAMADQVERKPRSYDADTESVPEAGSKYMVQRSETLWGIADRVRPDDVTVQQAMLDIQRLNPGAFIGNNINQLKAGYVLRLPAATDFSSGDSEAAASAVARQEERWQAAREGRRLDASEDSGVSTILDRQDSPGRLQIAGEEEETDYTAQEADVTASLEDLDRSERDNADMQARMQAMEERVENLTRLLTLKNEQIAALQNSVDTNGAALSGAIEPVAPEMDAMGDDSPPAEEVVVEVVEAAPEQVPAVQPAPEPGLTSMLGEYLIYILLLLLLLLISAVFLLRNKFFKRAHDTDGRAAAAADGDDEFADVELGEDDLIIDEFQEPEVTPEELESERGGSFIEAEEEDEYAASFESGDALAEADIYIAYGRYPQAVDLLKSAIAIEPVNGELRVKLMEACAEMAERQEFQQQYADLQLLGDEDSLAKGRELLVMVDGGEMWLDDLPNPSITMAEVDAARARIAERTPAVPAEVQEMPMVDLAKELEFEDVPGLDLDDDVSEDKLDLDLDLEFEDVAAPAPAAAATFDLDDAEVDDAGDAVDTFALDAELPESPEPVVDTANYDVELPDFDLDDVTSDAAVIPEGDSDEPTLEMADEMLTEFGELSIEGDDPAADGAVSDLGQSLDELSNSFTDGDSSADKEDLMFAADGDEIATKLDLARAYLDMGDDDGARTILQEVVSDGDNDQKQEAQSLLDGIG